MHLRRLVPSFLLAAAILVPTVPAAAQEPVVVYLVRHAERAEDGTDDPSISEKGQARAQLLAQLMRDTGISRIHSTGYKRTHQTVAPLAEATGLPVESYDARDLAGFASLLKGQPGRHLVVGHSNTTPGLVAALGGDAHGDIAEMEYDRLYIIMIPGDGPSTTVLLRFGARYRP